MAWKITQVDNGKKTYTLLRDTGHTITVSVPPQHQNEVTAQAYVQAVCDGNDHAINSPAKKPNLFQRLFKRK